MVKEGYYFGLPLLLIGGAAFFLHWRIAAYLLLFLALFVFSFFRDPDRVIPSEPGAIVSPGDGRVVVVQDEDYDGKPGKRVSIFLAVWNVHVNRSPAAGRITKMEYRPGKFVAAMRANASTENEQNIFTLSTDAGRIGLQTNCRPDCPTGGQLEKGREIPWPAANASVWYASDRASIYGCRNRRRSS